MRLFDTIAIIGALAWSIPLINLIRNKLVTPKMDLIFGQNAEIGFSMFGPIINMNFSFIAINKRALIEEIKLDLEHENHGQQSFEWQWFEEELYETNLPNAGPMPTKKHQSAIALNLPKEILIEKRIGFNGIEFIKNNKVLNDKVVEDLLLIMRNNEPNLSLEKKKSFSEYVGFYNQSFDWKVGKYTATVKTALKGVNKNYNNKFEFSLNAIEVEKLEANKGFCELSLRNTILPQDEQKDIQWNWVNPRINTI